MIPIGSHPVWHPVMETLAYTVGFAVYRGLRARQGDIVAEPQRWTVLAAAAVGALVGSRVLGLAEQWPTVTEAWRTGRMVELLLSPGGKTIVGGLLGGWLGVEIAKKFNGITRRTGDLFALPLCVGIAVGRVGCLLAGLADDTYGKPTALPWAVNLGDGIGRHPVQVYEILFLAILGFVVSKVPVASSVPAHDASRASEHGSTTLSAPGLSTVSGHDSTTVSAPRLSTVSQHDSATVPEPHMSIVSGHDSTTASGHDSSTVSSHDASTVSAPHSSTVSGHDSTTASGHDASTVSAPHLSTVSGHDFSRAEKMPQKLWALAPEGARFRIFLGSYLVWRVVIDFLKPQPLMHGLNLIQWSCMAGIVLLALDQVRVWKGKHEALRA